ncbi:PREDICTED: SRA stem-loop-interacting RNA-binding protein, mitochondrial-like [Nicrophorus vespilloides]|uniref:SRA stem-loop-interacting RNA-binding protein, mitochondrial-like n=1 Tax=Nicrophorus vespilloides TaxID=110193 RepID=A0ABM1MKK4_NICVS|nr:PREDICTED: SRA stem-loop-interacting RNA-binding protein, mitochondrial-like [Nicrophorus vespilloides]
MATIARNILKLYVGNVPWTIGNYELRQYFSKYGHVSSVSVIFDKNTGFSKNYGFVVYSNKDGFDTATNVTNHVLEGNNLKVEPTSN